MIAGYISANRIDFARVNKTAKTIRLERDVRLATRDYSNLNSALSQYIKNQKGQDAEAICLGVAGPVIRGVVRPTNLPWQIDEKSLAQNFGFKKVRLVNDVVATAHCLAHLSDDKFFEINAGIAIPDRNIGLIAAGSGLGASLIYVNGGTNKPYASEGGHATFSPGSQIEVELFEYLYADKGFVEAEDVISWVGLEHIYNFLIDTQGHHRGDWFDAAEYRASAVIEKALSGADDAATRALDIFIDCYANATANLALTGMTLGGMYVGGQIAPRIITALEKGRFMERFVKKGKMENLLSQMPIRLIIEDRAALIGAAAIVREM